MTTNKHHIVLDGDSSGTQKRIYQCVKKMLSLDARSRGTWCALFKTEGYNHTRCVMADLNRHITRFVRKEFQGNCGRWDIEMLGSNRLTDVQTGRGQRYLLSITPKEKQ